MGGAIIGAIIGGGKGAVIGGATGAGAGTTRSARSRLEIPVRTSSRSGSLNRTSR